MNSVLISTLKDLTGASGWSESVGAGVKADGAAGAVSEGAESSAVKRPDTKNATAQTMEKMIAGLYMVTAPYFGFRRIRRRLFCPNHNIGWIAGCATLHLMPKL
jgi:hypothetical protein